MWISHVDIGLIHFVWFMSKQKLKCLFKAGAHRIYSMCEQSAETFIYKQQVSVEASVVWRAKGAHVQSHGFKSRIGYLSEIGRLAGSRRSEVKVFDLLDFTRRRLVVCYRCFGTIYRSHLREIDVLYPNVGSYLPTYAAQYARIATASNWRAPLKVKKRRRR